MYHLLKDSFFKIKLVNTILLKLYDILTLIKKLILIVNINKSLLLIRTINDLFYPKDYSLRIFYKNILFQHILAGMNKKELLKSKKLNQVKMWILNNLVLLIFCSVLFLLYHKNLYKILVKFPKY